MQRRIKFWSDFLGVDIFYCSNCKHLIALYEKEYRHYSRKLIKNYFETAFTIKCAYCDCDNPQLFNFRQMQDEKESIERSKVFINGQKAFYNIVIDAINKIPNDKIVKIYDRQAVYLDDLRMLLHKLDEDYNSIEKDDDNGL